MMEYGQLRAVRPHAGRAPGQRRPRPAIAERYPSHAAYIAAVTRVCEARLREGLMLQEDADRFIAAARQKNPLDASVRLGSLIQAGAYSSR
jgi:hypothetical protein